MDIDFMKSAAEDHQMEMMLMQMENFSSAAAYDDQFNDDVSDDNTNNIHPPCTFYDNHLHGNHSYSGGGVSSYPCTLQLQQQQSDDEFPKVAAAGKRNSSMAAMREMIFRIAAMQPVNIDPETVKPPKRKNVKISTDPQSVAARHRRERISERIRILQRLVPGGTKMDTASMLDEAIHYVKFLKNQVQSLERLAGDTTGFPVPMSFPPKPCHQYYN